MKLLLVLSLLLILSGCAGLSGVPVSETELQFQLTGRAAVKYGSEGGSTHIVWRHAANADDLLISGPLGQGIARITRHESDVLLVTADGSEYRAQDVEALTESVLGWRLPLEGLPEWVQGRPAAGAQSRQFDENGRIREFVQNDWHVEYLAWTGGRPSRILLGYKAPGGSISVSIRLIIDTWKAGK